MTFFSFSSSNIFKVKLHLSIIYGCSTPSGLQLCKHLCLSRGDPAGVYRWVCLLECTIWLFNVKINVWTLDPLKQPMTGRGIPQKHKNLHPLDNPIAATQSQDRRDLNWGSSQQRIGRLRERRTHPPGYPGSSPLLQMPKVPINRRWKAKHCKSPHHLPQRQHSANPPGSSPARQGDARHSLYKINDWDDYCSNTGLFK